MEEIITKPVAACETCGCSQLLAIKKGFSGLYAILGFVAALIIMVVIAIVIISKQQSDDQITASVDAVAGMSHIENHIMFNWMLYSACAIIPLLGLFYGTVQMNDISILCLKCGKQKPLKP